MSYSVKILDCTLRDGGYLNDWLFGHQTIKTILENLHKAKIDFIECGFLKDCVADCDKTFFSTVEELEKYTYSEQEYTLMINFGEYSISKFKKCLTPNIKIRVAFKKYQQKEALEYIYKLKELGWGVFVNPMSTNTYTREELTKLIEEVNKIKPLGISIVDTLGNMYEKEVTEIFEYIDKLLDKNVAIGFHSHNSLQLSFSNTKALLKMKMQRDFIIDSCVYGMGRGAGNLCTELITKYLNDERENKYKITSILKIIDNALKPIYQKTPWGYSTPYYIAAIYGCHPNYAQTLVKMNYSDKEIDNILQKIPLQNRAVYDKKFIENYTN